MTEKKPSVINLIFIRMATSVLHINFGHPFFSRIVTPWTLSLQPHTTVGFRILVDNNTMKVVPLKSDQVSKQTSGRNSIPSSSFAAVSGGDSLLLWKEFSYPVFAYFYRSSFGSQDEFVFHLFFISFGILGKKKGI